MITLNKKSSPRQASYVKRVAAFINANGPVFTFVRLEGVPDGVCDCCGYNPLHRLFWVKNGNGQEFKVGSECQLFILGTEGVIPANKLRLLVMADLLALAIKMDVQYDGSWTEKELAEAIIDKRRSIANAKGWVARRAAQPAAPVEQVPTN